MSSIAAVTAPTSRQGTGNSGTDGFALATKAGPIYHFDPHGRLSAIGDRSGHTCRLEYDGGRLAEVIDAAGQTTTFDHDDAGRITAVNAVLGRRWLYAFSRRGDLTTVTDPEGGVTAYSYDADHRLVSITDPEGMAVVRNIYDGVGRVVEQRDGAGGPWRYRYEVAATVVTDPLGHTTTFRYDDRYRTTSVTDANGATTRLSWDEASNLIAVQAGRISRFAYNSRGDPTIAQASGARPGLVRMGRPEEPHRRRRRRGAPRRVHLGRRLPARTPDFTGRDCHFDRLGSRRPAGVGTGGRRDHPLPVRRRRPTCLDHRSAGSGDHQQRGEWRDPQLAKVRFESIAEQWLKSTTHLRAGTRANVEIRLRRHILPCFGAQPIGAIQPADVRAWVSGLTETGLSPSTVGAIYGILRRIMRTAEIDGLIHRTPCLGISLPKETSRQEMHFLDHAEVARLGAATDERYRALIFTAAYTGLRWGELAGLRVDRVNLLRGTVDVVEAMTETNGHLATAPTKTGARRTVSLPRFLSEMLGAHIAAFPTTTGLVFSSAEGQPSGGTSTAATSSRLSATPGYPKR